MSNYKIVLAGAPRVGKSSIYRHIREQMSLETSSSQCHPVQCEQPSSEVVGQQYFFYQSGTKQQRRTVSPSIATVLQYELALAYWSERQEFFLITIISIVFIHVVTTIEMC